MISNIKQFNCIKMYTNIITSVNNFQLNNHLSGGGDDDYTEQVDMLG